MREALQEARRAPGSPRLPLTETLISSLQPCRIVRLRLGRPTLAVAALLQSVAALAFLAQAYATGDATVEVDIWLANVLHANVAPSATAVLTAVTMLGSTAVLALVAGTAGAYLAGRGRGRDAALLVVALVGTQLLGWILKAIFERPRPSFDDPVATASWFSFPSGHAMSSIALYGALAYVFADRLCSVRRRIAGLGGLALLVAAIGFSRLYFGVHYLTDVLAGYSAGLAWLLLAIGLLHARSQRDRAGNRGARKGGRRQGGEHRRLLQSSSRQGRFRSYRRARETQAPAERVI